MIDNQKLVNLISSAVELTKVEIAHTENPHLYIHNKSKLKRMIQANLVVILNIYNGKAHNPPCKNQPPNS